MKIPKKQAIWKTLYHSNDFGLLGAFCLLLLVGGISACDNGEQPGFTPNTMAALLNGAPWESGQVSVNVQQVNNELQIRMAGIVGSNEAVYLGISVPEAQILGTHTITSQANGEFLAYSAPGSAGLIETHTSFNCPTISGAIIVEDYNANEGYISGSFLGTICELNGGQLRIEEGTFFRIDF